MFLFVLLFITIFFPFVALTGSFHFLLCKLTKIIYCLMVTLKTTTCVFDLLLSQITKISTFSWYRKGKDLEFLILNSFSSAFYTTILQLLSNFNSTYILNQKDTIVMTFNIFILSSIIHFLLHVSTSHLPFPFCLHNFLQYYFITIIDLVCDFLSILSFLGFVKHFESVVSYFLLLYKSQPLSPWYFFCPNIFPIFF